MVQQSSRPSRRTLVAQTGKFSDPATGAIIPPIHPSTTYVRDRDYALIGGFEYARYANPTVAEAETLLARLDGGHEALCFASGMAVIAAVLETLEKGVHVVAPRVMYHGTLNWLGRIAERRGMRVDLFDGGNPDALANIVKEGETALVWIETPTNPTWDVIDIARAAEIAHAAGAQLVVDSTCAPPVTTRPLEHGADIVFHSATKYLNGHSDITGGVLVTWEDGPIWRQLREVRGLSGSVMGAFEAWLLIRGLKTLYLRFDAISQTAMKIARHFEAHSKIASVLYPGLESHPGHDVAKKQMDGGFGGMMSFLVGERFDDARRLVTALNVFVRATSLGSVESLAEHRKAIEGARSPVADNLVRLSIGIEEPDELIADLEQALEAV